MQYAEMKTIQLCPDTSESYIISLVLLAILHIHILPICIFLLFMGLVTFIFHARKCRYYYYWSAGQTLLPSVQRKVYCLNIIKSKQLLSVKRNRRLLTYIYFLMILHSEELYLYTVKQP